MTLPTDPTPYGEYLADMAAAAEGATPAADDECACRHTAAAHAGEDYDGECEGDSAGGVGPAAYCECDGFEWPVVARLEQHRGHGGADPGAGITAAAPGDTPNDEADRALEGDEPDPDVATMDDGTILGRQTAKSLGIAGNGPPPRTTRYYLGVTDSGFKVSTGITGRWTGDPRPLPIAALREDLAAMTSGDVLDPLLVADESPQLWPVSREVYAAWNDLEPADLDYVDEDNEARDDEPVGPTIADPVTGEVSEVGPEDADR